jgi:uncharacterized protein
MMRRLFATVFFAMLPGAAFCVDFDCFGALTSQEQLICRPSQFSGLDSRLNQLYTLALILEKPDDSVRLGQRQWLVGSRSKCSDSQCLEAAYVARIQQLMTFIEQRAEPLPSVLSAEVHHAVTDGGYCKVSSAKTGDWMSVALSTTGPAVTGSIDGIFDCARKVWGPIDVAGDRIGNVVLVRFDPGFSESPSSKAEALVVGARGGRVYWQVLSEIKLDSWVPVFERLQRGP